MSVGIWQIGEQGPQRIKASNVELEQHLEDWAAADPMLLQAGLVILGRQLHTEGGPLDLLAMDYLGRWIVIEIKRGMVRRDTIAQALDYASCIARMPGEQLRESVDAYLHDHPAGNMRTLDDVLEQRGIQLDDEEERDVAMMVVGTSRDPGLERIVDFLSERGGIPISVITFEVFSPSSGQQVLVRELTESDDEPDQPSRKSKRSRTPTMEEFYKRARSHGTEEAMRKFIEGGVRAGLHPRLYPQCVMLTPQANKNRCLAGSNLAPTKDGLFRSWVAPSAFSEFFDLSEGVVEEQLGSGYVDTAPDAVDQLVDRLVGLFGEGQD